MEKPSLIARDLEKLGDVAKITGQREKAVSYYDRSTQIYRQLEKSKELERLRKTEGIPAQN
jgi:hypothetical protein